MTGHNKKRDARIRKLSEPPLPTTGETHLHRQALTRRRSRRRRRRQHPRGSHWLQQSDSPGCQPLKHNSETKVVAYLVAPLAKDVNGLAAQVRRTQTAARDAETRSHLRSAHTHKHVRPDGATVPSQRYSWLLSRSFRCTCCSAAPPCPPCGFCNKATRSERFKVAPPAPTHICTLTDFSWLQKGQLKSVDNLRWIW